MQRSGERGGIYEGNFLWGSEGDFCCALSSPCGGIAPRRDAHSAAKFNRMRTAGPSDLAEESLRALEFSN
jgi:hypothetical protein